MTSRPRQTTTSIRFTAEELAAIHEYAEQHGNTVSGIVRHIVLTTIKKDKQRQKEAC